MTTVTVIRHINAPAPRVFEAAADIASFPDVNPDVLKIEFLTSQSQGVGTRFIETRRMGKKEIKTELEVTEYDPEAMQIRMVTDMGGTLWDTLFLVRETDGGAELTASMDCRAHAFIPKLLNPLMKGFFRKSMEKHIGHFQVFCEGQ